MSTPSTSTRSNPPVRTHWYRDRGIATRIFGTTTALLLGLDRNAERGSLAVAQHVDPRGGTDRAVGDQPDKLRRVGDGGAVDGHDDVAGLSPFRYAAESRDNWFTTIPSAFGARSSSARRALSGITAT